MHPYLYSQLADLRASDMRHAAAGPRSAMGRTAADGSPAADVVIRRAVPADGPALAALSALDAAPLPLGPALVAEVAGSPVAALPLSGGRAFADPFRRTHELVALLELRADQLRRSASSAGSAGEPGEPGVDAERRRGLLARLSPAALR
jgi:hypothetical protein